MPRQPNYKLRTVHVPILASKSYCSNDCQYMSASADRCNLFHKSLTWQPWKATHGNRRLKECVDMETNDGDK